MQSERKLSDCFQYYRTLQIADNRQKIYFRLTDKGEFLYKEHDRRHKLWLERDARFLSQFTE